MTQIVTCKNCKNDTFNSNNSSIIICPHCFEKINIKEYLEYKSSLKSTNLILASNVKRRITQVIDIIISLFTSIFLIIIINSYNPNLLEGDKILLVLLFIPIYFLFFEFIFGKTIGKFVTQTKVVQINGEKITFKQAIIRGIIRFIPFNRLSGILNNGIYGHDTISKTRVIDIYLNKNKTT